MEPTEPSHCPIPPHPTILLLNSRPWLYDIKVAGLKDVSDDQLLAAVGNHTDVVWLQGCWELGPYGQRHDVQDPGRLQHFKDCLPDFTEDDCIGSPYAIRQYICNPSLGTEELPGSFSAAYDKVIYDRLTESHLDKLREHLYQHPRMCTGKFRRCPKT
eukprot:g30029.t1